MHKQATELRYAVRFRVVFKYFGQLCLVLAVLTVVPLAVSLILGDTRISLRYGLVIGGLATFGAGLARLRVPAKVQVNEGVVLVALMYLFTPFAMSYPMMGSGLGFLDAPFESISGVTTTGLSTMTLVDSPQTLLFARAWMQWYGGLGVVVLSLALIIRPGFVRSVGGLLRSNRDGLLRNLSPENRLVLWGHDSSMGVIVLPDQITVGRASEAFDDSGGLKDANQRGRVRDLGQSVADMVSKITS